MSNVPFLPSTGPPSLLLFGGKGGVGKTTLATATALHLADTHSAVRLLSTDPAPSLYDSLAASGPPAALSIDEFAADPALDAFRNAHRATLHAIVDRGTLFDDADIEHLLDLSLPGLDEVMAFLHLADVLAADAEDCVVVDTAPTGHTLRLLNTPEQFTRWINVLDIMLDKHRYMRSVFGSGAADALDDFIDTMHARAECVRTALHDPSRCRLYVVTQAEPMIVAETVDLLRYVHTHDLPVTDVLINRWADASSPADRQYQHEALRAYAASDLSLGLWACPDVPHEVRGEARLRHLMEQTTPLSIPEKTAAPPHTDATDGPAVPLPTALPQSPLLFVGGKGGVGKTTIAVATALRWAEEMGTPQRPVLLASTDPAHSIHAALQNDLGDAPTPVEDGLYACEIDAVARFEALRDAYVDEVRQFFDRTGGANVDLTYDRPVMEGLMDLAPPGIDEIMGLTAVMDVLDDTSYVACVIDTAPTGHLLRLLDMPAVFESWIRALFRILQKYRDVLHLPRLSDRLVRLSKQVKRLQQRMTTPRETSLLVTLPTEMAAAETETLLDRARRLDLAVGPLVVNRVASAHAPAARRAEHARVLNTLRQQHPEMDHALVRNGPPVHGRAAFRRLGRRLYASPS